MSDCQYNSLLEAYHDGELRAGQIRALEEHLSACPQCTRALERIRNLSGIVAGAKPASEILPIDLARIHAAIDGTEDRSLFRFAVGMSGIAASILIISAAWLYDGPRPSGPVQQGVANSEQSWEYLATTGRVREPLDAPGVTRQTGVAETETTDWMLLKLGKSRP